MAEVKGTTRMVQEKMAPELLSRDLERYQQMALAEGATDAKVIPAQWVNVDERVRLKCLIPRCGNYGECSSCPPHLPEPEFFRKAFSRYNWAILFKNDVPADDIADYVRPEGRTPMKHVRKTTEIAGKVEISAFADGYYLALGLSSGGCKLAFCQGTFCQVIDSGRCRFPLKARPSMEAACIDAFGLVTRAGWQIYPVYQGVDPSLVPCILSVGLVFIS